MRGEHYVWSDGETLHWNEFSVPLKKMDEFVVMRYARMTKKEIKEAEKRALANYPGNFGCDALSKKYGHPTCIGLLKKVAKNYKKKGKKDGKKM
jgi:hypothetical protein